MTTRKTKKPTTKKLVAAETIASLHTLAVGHFREKLAEAIYTRCIAAQLYRVETWDGTPEVLRSQKEKFTKTAVYARLAAEAFIAPLGVHVAAPTIENKDAPAF